MCLACMSVCKQLSVCGYVFGLWYMLIKTSCVFCRKINIGKEFQAVLPQLQGRPQDVMYPVGAGLVVSLSVGLKCLGYACTNFAMVA